MTHHSDRSRSSWTRSHCPFCSIVNSLDAQFTHQSCMHGVWCWIDECASREWRMEMKATHILIDLIDTCPWHTNIMSFSFNSQFSWCRCWTVAITWSSPLMMATVHCATRELRIEVKRTWYSCTRYCRWDLSEYVLLSLSILHSLEAQSPIQHHHSYMHGYVRTSASRELIIEQNGQWERVQLDEIYPMMCHLWYVIVDGREVDDRWLDCLIQSWISQHCQVTLSISLTFILQLWHNINDTPFDRSRRAQHVLIVHFVQLSTLLMHCLTHNNHAWVVVVLDWWVCFKRMENGGESNTYTDRSHRVTHEYHVLFIQFSILLKPVDSNIHAINGDDHVDGCMSTTATRELRMEWKGHDIRV